MLGCQEWFATVFVCHRMSSHLDIIVENLA
ncbi:MAG: hypothetical protein J07HX64_01264 [halophilic archaeon J07HX64]|nr:MAG: hypothetical protein J07HX64_01264 [halophilic archaeon J07HX64]